MTYTVYNEYLVWKMIQIQRCNGSEGTVHPMVNVLYTHSSFLSFCTSITYELVTSELEK
ncbi:hypothetical protein JOC77_000814 [Peribacillus deserti]|uniref:Uncharacterized protein n=1 Tax=Peribacillus deserti TaxID=673318 RepID=A0ABS2QF09_9BACI|nr:hypothetical protein [Peribacillus deserti]